jgi:hypothetical protein
MKPTPAGGVDWSLLFHPQHSVLPSLCRIPQQTTSVSIASRNMESGIHADERERQEENNCELHPVVVAGRTGFSQRWSR